MTLQYIKPEPILLKDHPEFNEVWLRQRIEEDPSILNLGDLEVRDVERIHPKAGRLDLLLRDPETSKRYEVELMLGTVNESHIIRAIEYWDIERKRYPQFEHAAVIVAERITSRFLNVISLFNGAIPLIALQLNAIRVGDSIALHFTKVLDEVSLGTDDDEDPPGVPADRAYWEKRAGKESMKVVDECVAIWQSIAPGPTSNYTKSYIGLSAEGRSNRFVFIRARREFIKVDIRVDDIETCNRRLEDAGIEVMAPSPPNGVTSFRFTLKDMKAHRELLADLFRASYSGRNE